MQGYYRQPAIHKDTLVFVSEDDLWSVAASGGLARRLTSGLGGLGAPAISPDGKWIAYSGREEGHAEVYVMPAGGGEPRRLTYLGSFSLVAGWDSKGRIIFSSPFEQPFGSLARLYAIALDGGAPELLPTGPALSISYGPGGGCVIGRNSRDAAHWKRYRGGTAGDLWIDPTGSGNFRRLLELQGNPSRPLWLGKRIYFVSDHEGIGNLYSCLTNGKDVKRHTHHQDFYVRFPSSDGRRIAYQCGADLYVFDPETNASSKVEIEYMSPRTQRNRKFADAGRYLDAFSPHPQGHLLAVATRGKAFTLGNWEGPVVQHGELDGVRYRLPRWLNDGNRFVAVSDAEGEETLEIHHREGSADVERLKGLDLGRVVDMEVSPKADRLALSNHRNEVILVDLVTKKSKVLEKSSLSLIQGFDWSPDGVWIAYSCGLSRHTSAIKMVNADSGKIHSITTPVLNDVGPSFDPEGKYLYFLSYRDFDPVYDNLHFDLGFPKGVRPFLVTLRKDLPSPFVPVPKPAEDKSESKDKDDKDKEKEKENGKAADTGSAVKSSQAAKKEKKSDEKSVEKDEQKGEKEKSEKDKKDQPLVIDFDGIQDRIVGFPVPEGRYYQIAGIKGKVLFVSVPVEGSLNINWSASDGALRGTLEAYDFDALKAETLVSGISYFVLNNDRKFLAYRAGGRIRVMKAGEKSDEGAAKEGPGKKSGWVDLSRIKMSVRPLAEWRQMFREAWRLQRDQFWTEDMSRIDWKSVYERYLPLVDRIATRGEFSDLCWEMQGELGTSHAYEFGGDHRSEPHFGIGFLGADIHFDKRSNAWKIRHIIQGDGWDEKRTSPLLRPGLNIHAGDTILAIGGRKLTAQTPPSQCLVHLAGHEILLTVGDKNGKNPRTVTVKTLGSEGAARYREWVERNRATVHQRSGGRVGYVHIPNMGPWGYAEFHRYYLAEIDREGLIVDVRFNGGGHVSELILEKLARRRIAYCKTRWFGTFPYPQDSVAGPMVALTNEFAGSDGDIFSHGFKLLKLGPLIGKRTWGGVIGIWPRHALVDGGLTTQPEFSFWFSDVGWAVENYGTDPDIDVDYRPQDYVQGKDPQMERALQEIQRLLRKNPPREPKFDKRPSLAIPKLPKA
jgi:tricorn protease